MDSFLNLSGGIDSTLCMYHYLRENPDKTLLVHHCHMQNVEGRKEVETKAVADVLAWLQAEGLTNYEYLETHFDSGTTGYGIYDHELFAFLAGMVLRRRVRHSVHRIIVPFIKVDVHTPDRDVRYMRVLRSMIPRRRMDLVTPLIHMTKEQVIRALPRDLLVLTWYCRRPQQGSTCGVCRTCLQVQPVLRSL